MGENDDYEYPGIVQKKQTSTKIVAACVKYESYFALMVEIATLGSHGCEA